MRKFYFLFCPGTERHTFVFIPLSNAHRLRNTGRPGWSVNGEISAFSKKFGRKSVAVNRRSDGDMGTAVARQAPKLVELV